MILVLGYPKLILKKIKLFSVYFLSNSSIRCLMIQLKNIILNSLNNYQYCNWLLFNQYKALMNPCLKN
ncbi:hypothetical protein SAMN06265367_10253 [Algoriphagus winogradskyi]|uniref:Uncharacterized protein n=1 Tax=Algoriphagus winogradskyi TaxID=237017 RepID=A0ABY1NKG6_9BACT|nr:hypothetical protein SAMN06265367_10253 [Algoriphagus winogradskyi]